VNGKVLTIGLLFLAGSLVAGIVMLGVSESIAEKDGIPYADTNILVHFDQFILTEDVPEASLSVHAPYFDLRVVSYEGSFDYQMPSKNATNYENCDPNWGHMNDPCKLEEWPALSNGTVIVISGWSEFDTGDWNVSVASTEIAKGTVSVLDPSMGAVDCCSTEESDDIAALGILTCCCGPLIGIIITIAGISMRDPAAAAVVATFGAIPMQAGAIGQPGINQAAFVAQPAPLSQPIVHGTIPGAVMPTQQPPTPSPMEPTPPPPSAPSTEPTSTDVDDNQKPPFDEPPAPEPIEQLTSSEPTPTTVVQNITYNIQDSAIAGDIHAGMKEDSDTESNDAPMLDIEEAISALSNAFSTSERLAILHRIAPQDLSFTVDEERRTMGVGIPKRLSGGQTVTGTLMRGQEISVRLPNTAGELEIGDPWKGRGKAVDWNAISKTLVFESE